MKTDRELLELAAKAAGIPRNRWDYEWLLGLGHRVTPLVLWNPITDDGDAFRLAALLNIDILNGSSTLAQAIHHPSKSYSDKPKESDPAAAARYAVVCVAAAIQLAKEAP